MKKLTVLFALCALVPFTLAACGDDDEETTAVTTTEETGATGGGEVVDVDAVPDGSFAFEQDTLEAAAGAATFEFTNDATVGHDFCLEQDGSEVGCTEVISEDSTALDADLETGEYTYYCDVAGHREGGMEGTLTVK